MKSHEAMVVFKNRCAKARRHYTNVLEDFEAEEIHQFRLQLKKMRAFLSLLNAGRAGEEKATIGKGIHAFYQTVGELRNLQLHGSEIHRLCKKLHFALPGSYLQSLQQKEKEAKIAARETALRNPLHKRCRKLLAMLPKRVSEEAVERFAAEHKHRLIKNLLAGNYADESLHGLRKLLKRFLYLWPWVEAEMAPFVHSAFIDKSTCLRLCEKLGAFQDRCIALRFFDAYFSGTKTGAAEGPVLSALRQYTQDEKQRLKNELVEELRTCVRRMQEKDVLLPIYNCL